MLASTTSDPHTLAPAEVCAEYGVQPKFGLTEEQVLQNRRRFGNNVLACKLGKSLFRLILDQFQDFLVRILLAAAVISFVLVVVQGEYASGGFAAFVEPLVILLILIANAFVSVWQESNAEASLASLRKLQPELAKVLREGKLCVVAAADLVPGDIIEVRVGDKIPADCRIVEVKTTSFRVEQSQLTGESTSVPKDSTTMNKEMRNCEIQLKRNILFSSTTVVNGTAVAVVAATGMHTEIGKIQTAVEDACEEEDLTPLQAKIDEFGGMLSKVIGVICVLVWIFNFKHFSDPIHGGFARGCVYYFKIAVALAVAAIPEGLPAVITTCLAMGTKKMAQRNAIVRHLPSVETLGCTTVICSDKTGTLTTNEMTCVEFCVADPSRSVERYQVEGHSLEPVGRITRIGTSEHKFVSDGDVGLKWFARTAAICNGSTLEFRDGQYRRIGEPTEAALKVLVEKLGMPFGTVRSQQNTEMYCNLWTEGFKVLATLEFSRDRKSMSVLAKDKSTNDTVLFVKGAPETILARSNFLMLPDGCQVPFTSDLHESFLREVDRMGTKALRTLALAVRRDNCGALKGYDGPLHHQHEILTNPNNFASVESNLVFLGLVGILDPPRPEVAESIGCCRRAGIRVMMVTGDNKKTAEAIAVRIGIVSEESLWTNSLTGMEFESLCPEKRMKILASDGCVFSRTEPRHKTIIVRTLREMGEVTAMTGDGVNDAPALKLADIGISMGISGTEVAKEASDMVLADDNFSTVVSAVEEGRSIYNNMKAFIRYLISSNIGEVASIFLTAAIGIPEGFAPVQLLWVNLVTDGLPATALGFNPPDVDVMSKPPRKRSDPLINSWILFRYLVIGMYVGIATVGIFIWWYTVGIDLSDGHSLVSVGQLMNFNKCSSWSDFSPNFVNGMHPTDPCSYFTGGKIKASTLSLTVLVVIEMLNSFNALSEDGSLLVVPPWSNKLLLLAVAGSIGIHCVILYVPFFAGIFGVVPLSLREWGAVVLWSLPVIVLDEILKSAARRDNRQSTTDKKKM